MHARILLADDDASIREMIALGLRGAGIDVLIEADATAGRVLAWHNLEFRRTPTEFDLRAKLAAWLRPLALALLLPAISAACAPGTGPPPAASPPASPSGATRPVSVYLFLADERGEPGLVPVLREVRAGAAPEAAALEALLAGPTDEEAAGTAPLTTAIPNGTRAVGLIVDRPVATVDLTAEYASGGGSESMFGRLAQIVYTLTQFDEVEAVAFLLDGRPLRELGGEGIVLDGPQTREDYTEQLPEIFVDTPGWGAEAPSPVRIRGLTRVFEATFQAQLFDDRGLVLAERVVTASCGTGCWGTFETELTYTVDRDQLGSLRVFEASANDGSPVNVRVYPIRLRRS